MKRYICCLLGLLMCLATCAGCSETKSEEEERSEDTTTAVDSDTESYVATQENSDGGIVESDAPADFYDEAGLVPKESWLFTTDFPDEALSTTDWKVEGVYELPLTTDALTSLYVTDDTNDNKMIPFDVNNFPNHTLTGVLYNVVTEDTYNEDLEWTYKTFTMLDTNEETTVESVVGIDYMLQDENLYGYYLPNGAISRLLYNHRLENNLPSDNGAILSSFINTYLGKPTVIYSQSPVDDFWTEDRCNNSDAEYHTDYTIIWVYDDCAIMFDLIEKYVLYRESSEDSWKVNPDETLVSFDAWNSSFTICDRYTYDNFYLDLISGHDSWIDITAEVLN